jgi:hypothetical protein
MATADGANKAVSDGRFSVAITVDYATIEV